MRWRKLPARAMMFAIMISLLIAMIAAALIGLSEGQRNLQQQALTIEKLIRNADSGIELLLAGYEAEQEKSVDLFDKGRDSVLVSVRDWGLFHLAKSKSVQGRDSFERMALLGLHPSGKQAVALYLADGNSPLAVCGKTVVRGMAYLPRAGVRRGTIPTAPYSAAQLIFGTTANSSYNLEPSIANKKIDYLKACSELSANAEFPADSTSASFSGAPKVIRAASLNIQQSLSGQIILIADREIRFGADAQVSDILVFAPKIVFESGFRGQLQAFAFDSLLVAPDCHFSYPSCLGLLRKSSLAEAPLLELDSLSSLKGVIWMKELETGTRKARVRLAPNTEVEGLIWVDGYLELSGRVWGSVACRKFSLQTQASLYENHLLDAEIDYAKLHKAFLLPAFFEGGGERGLAKWVY